MKSPRPPAITADVVVAQPQFASLAQFLPGVHESSITDSQAGALGQLLTNLHCYFAACRSAYGAADPLARLLDTVTSAHELQANFLRSRVAALSEKCARLEGDAGRRPGDDAPVVAFLSANLGLREGIQTRKGLLREIQARIAASEPLVAAVSRSFQLPPGLTAQTVLPALAERLGAPGDAKRLHHCRAQVRDLNAALDRLYGQYQQQSAELREAAREKRVLSAAVSDLLRVSQAHESRAPPAAQCPNVIGILGGIAIPEVTAICRADAIGPVQKARLIVDAVNSSLTPDKNSQTANLRSIVCGLFRFLNSLSSQRDFRALMGSTSFDVCKTFMAKQVKALHAFFREKAIGYVEDTCLFEELLKKRDMGDLIRTIDAFVPTCSVDNELFLALMQAVAANDVLRKFALDSLEALSRQRREAEQAEQEPVKREVHPRNDQAIAAVQNRLRTAILKHETAIQPILDSLRELNAVTKPENADYVEALEREIAELQEAIGDSEARADAYLKQANEAHADAQRAEEKLASFQQAAASEKEAIGAEHRRLADQIRAQAGEVTFLRKANDQITVEKDSTLHELSELEGKAIATIAELVRSFEATRMDCVRLLEIKDHRLRQFESTVSYLKARAVEQKAQFRSLISAERNERNALEMLVQQQAGRAQDESDVKTMDGEIMKLTSQIEALKKRLKAQKREHLQKIAQQEAVLNAKLAKVESDAKQKLEHAAKGAQNEIQTFLSNIQHLLTPYFEGTFSPTFAGIDALLRKATAELDRQPALLKAKGELDEARSVLNGTGDIVGEIRKLLKLTDQRSEVTRLREDLDGLTGWVERLFAVYGRGEVAAQADLPVMKTAIEALLRRTTREASRGSSWLEEPPSSIRSFSSFIFD
jgi:hypothetical protein